MPTLIPVIITIDEYPPAEALADLYHGLFSKSCHHNVSLFQSTISCALTLARPDHVITVIPFEYAGIANEQLAQSHIALKNHVLITPSHKPSMAITIAACHALAKFTDPVLWIIPIHQTTYYTGVLKHAIMYSTRAAFQGSFILFGLKAYKPDTNYAYIINGKHFDDFDKLQHLRMFIPHPSEKTVESMWQQPYCLAHSGVILASASHWLNYVNKDVKALASESYRNSKDSYYGQLMDNNSFKDLPNQSIIKHLGLLSQQNNHPIASYTLPIDTSKQNGWYQLWQQSQNEARGNALEKFLYQINKVA